MASLLYSSWRGGQLLELCKGKLGVSDVVAQWEAIVSTLSMGQGCWILDARVRTEDLKA